MTDENERERRRAEIHKGWASVARIADVKIEHRAHRDDGLLSDWSRGMPPKTPTLDEVKQIVRDEIAKQPGAVTSAEIEATVERFMRKHSVVTLEAIAPVLVELRQQLRDEIKAHKPGAEFRRVFLHR